MGTQGENSWWLDVGAAGTNELERRGTYCNLHNTHFNWPKEVGRRRLLLCKSTTNGTRSLLLLLATQTVGGGPLMMDASGKP